MKKITFVMSFLPLIFLSCQVNKPEKFTGRKFVDLTDYKEMSQYIITHNYHCGFAKNNNYELSNAPDSMISNFMRRKRVIAIYYSRDSLIIYGNYIQVTPK